MMMMGGVEKKRPMVTFTRVGIGHRVLLKAEKLRDRVLSECAGMRGM